jgi:hypothetical protein
MGTARALSLRSIAAQAAALAVEAFCVAATVWIHIAMLATP